MSASSKRTDKPSKADKSDRSGKKEGSLVPVVIFGQTYSVRADEDGSYIEELARYVDTKMRTLAESTGTSDSLKVAVLAALNIADEFFKLEQGQKSGEAENRRHGRRAHESPRRITARADIDVACAPLILALPCA